MNSPIYTVQNATRTYSNRTVLNVECLQIPACGIFTIVGPSGAGKSTLLRLLALLEPPTSGIVRLNLDGNSFKHSNLPLHRRRDLAMVFQQPALLSRSVRENIAYGLHIRGCRQASTQVDAILEALHLIHLANAPARTLSGGEKQRVAIARALVLTPRVLILDEPTANLDPYNIRIIEDLLDNYRKTTTIIMVTHNIFQARRLADHAALLLDGKLVEQTNNHTFFNAPSDPRTAAFVNGDMIY